MKKYVTNYSIIRFLPYRETEEFINIGILLSCPQTGYFKYKLEKTHSARITGFFPELDIEIYKKGRKLIENEMHRCLDIISEETPTQFFFDFGADTNKNIFSYLTSIKEGLFIFSNTSTKLSDNPDKTLDELFCYYISRNFAKKKQYNEVEMTEKLKMTFDKFHLILKPQRLGNDNFNITIPFVSSDKNKAIKPLYLSHTITTKIYDHGDAWISRIKRLQKLGKMPKHFLFATQKPTKNDKVRFGASQEIEKELLELGLSISDYSDEKKIISFAE